MKNILLVFLFLTLVPSIAFGNSAAPYTEEALQKINAAIADTPKEEPGPESSREEVHRQNVEYFSGVFSKAGYDFSATIDKIVDDMKNNPQAIPADRETVYNKIFVLLHILMHECDSDKINCLEFYPVATGESIQWFRENSGFSLQNHHKAK